MEEVGERAAGDVEPLAGKTLGDTITYTDEYGRPFSVKLVGGLASSIFQGSILIIADNGLEVNGPGSRK